MKATTLLFVFCIILYAGYVHSAADKPHIFFLMIDDYGWANVGYHNNSQNNAEIHTPNLNALVQVGIELDRHYVYRFCSPSRSSFLSGRNPIHVNSYNLETNYNPQNNVSGYAGVPINMTMIPAKLKTAGYATHYSGKWDAGFATHYHLPINRGFDTGFGYHEHANDYWQFYGGGCGGGGEKSRDLWNDTKPAKQILNPASCSQANQSENCVYEDDIILGDVLAQLDAHPPNTPLFYYWAPHNIHGPLEVPVSYLNKYSNIADLQRREYTAMVHHMDDMVGQVVAKLKEKGLWDNLLLVMSADNGGPVYAKGGANNYPLKGGKTSNWEGGIRVNAFVSGGYVPQSLRGTKSESFIAISDWYATFCALAGVDPTDSAAKYANLPPIDSYNVWPLLSGTNTTNPRTEIPIGLDNGGNGNNVIVQGIIVPPYKLLQGVVGTSYWQGPLYPNKTTNFTHQAEMKTNCGNGCLFNILQDPTEHNDIAAKNPDIVTTLAQRIAYYQKTVFNADRGPVDPNACAAAKNIYGGYMGPWVTPEF